MIIITAIAVLTLLLVVREGGQLGWVTLVVCIGFSLLYWRRVAAILVVAFLWLAASKSPVPRAMEFLLVEPSVGRAQSIAAPKLACLEFEKSGPPTARYVGADQCSISERQAYFSRLLGAETGDHVSPSRAESCRKFEGPRVVQRAHRCNK